MRYTEGEFELPNLPQQASKQPQNTFFPLLFIFFTSQLFDNQSVNRHIVKNNYCAGFLSSRPLRQHYRKFLGAFQIVG